MLLPQKFDAECFFLALACITAFMMLLTRCLIPSHHFLVAVLIKSLAFCTFLQGMHNLISDLTSDVIYVFLQCWLNLCGPALSALALCLFFLQGLLNLIFLI